CDPVLLRLIVIGEYIPRDLKDPGFKPPSRAKTLSIPDESEEHILCKVCRQLSIKRHLGQKVEDPLMVALKQNTRLPKVAALNGLHYRFVGHQVMHFRSRCRVSLSKLVRVRLSVLITA